MTTRAAALELFLRRLMLRSPLNDAERQAIRDLPGEVVTTRANHDIVRLGEVVDRTCLVASGLLGRFAVTVTGDRQISAFHIPGDMPDLYSYVLPRSSWALTALTLSTVVHVPHSAIREISNRYPAITHALWRDCTIDAAVTVEWLLNNGRRPARARTAHLLCEMAARYEQIEQFIGLRYTFPVTQAQLADALALTPVHVNRTLASLRKAGIVNMSGKNVEILDWGAISRLSAFDPAYLQMAGAGA